MGLELRQAKDEMTYQHQVTILEMQIKDQKNKALAVKCN